MTHRAIGWVVVALAIGGASAGDLGAQAQREAARPQQGRPPQGRPALDRLATAVQRQLGLTADEAARLRDATRDFAVQREALNRRDRATRLALRAAMVRGDSADESSVARHLDEVVAVQRRRADLLAEEQRELASFLTPLQRARFMAMQERAMRAAQQIRAQRDASERGGPPRRPFPEP